MDKRKVLKKILISFAIVLIVFTIILSGLYVIGSSDYGYSIDQMEILEKLGKPDSFILTLSGDRYEEWNFNKGGLMVGFYNGTLTTFDEIEPASDNAVSASYDPGQKRNRAIKLIPINLLSLQSLQNLLNLENLRNALPDNTGNPGWGVIRVRNIV